ncbi:hypothetical protein H9P43_000352 [Blastocladiella emersonii ATCC 22665]|nr:hypothetical protein H9P43_000352 [Blastocladiella emersonii ATCC 22665]
MNFAWIKLPFLRSLAVILVASVASAGLGVGMSYAVGMIPYDMYPDRDDFYTRFDALRALWGISLTIFWVPLVYVLAKHFAIIFPELAIRDPVSRKWNWPVVLLFAAASAILVFRLVYGPLIIAQVVGAYVDMNPLDYVLEQTTFALVCGLAPILLRIQARRLLPEHEKHRASFRSPTPVFVLMAVVGWILTMEGYRIGFPITILGVALSVVYTFAWVYYHKRKGRTDRIRGHFDLAVSYFLGYFLLRVVSFAGQRLPALIEELLDTDAFELYELVSPVLWAGIMMANTLLMEKTVPLLLAAKSEVKLPQTPIQCF